MNEESADVKIRKNRRRIFDAETFVQFNQAQVFVGRSVIEENRSLALKNFATAAQGNRELLLSTVADVLRNRQVMVDMLSPATPEEERFKSSMANTVKIEELQKQAEFNKSMLEINQLMVDVNKLLIEINAKTKETNEGLLEHLDGLSTVNAKWLDGELEANMRASSATENEQRITSNAAAAQEVSETANSNREKITSLYQRAAENRSTILKTAIDLKGTKVGYDSETQINTFITDNVITFYKVLEDTIKLDLDKSNAYTVVMIQNGKSTQIVVNGGGDSTIKITQGD